MRPCCVTVFRPGPHLGSAAFAAACTSAASERALLMLVCRLATSRGIWARMVFWTAGVDRTKRGKCGRHGSVGRGGVITWAPHD